MDRVSTHQPRDFSLVSKRDAVQNYVMTKHAMERCADRGFDFRSVARGEVRTAVVVCDEYDEATVVTVLPRGARVQCTSAHVLRKRRARRLQKTLSIARRWFDLSTKLVFNHVPECWEDAA